MILSAQSIRKRRIITPFCEKQKAFGMTYGLSSAGYDVRVAETFDILAGRSVLASTLEFFTMPNDLIAKVADKSTWARQFMAVQNTIIEPGWCGHLTLELSNHSDAVIELVEGMPIAQIIFMQLDEPTDHPYDGKYQFQQCGPQPAIFERNDG